MATPGELAEAAFEALRERGVEGMLDYVHPDFEMETLPGIAAEPQVYRGHDGVRRWWDSFYEVMDEITVAPRKVAEMGPDRALVHFHMSAKGRSSGLEVEQDARAIATSRDDKVLSLEFLLPEEPDPPLPG